MLTPRFKRVGYQSLIIVLISLTPPGIVQPIYAIQDEPDTRKLVPTSSDQASTLSLVRKLYKDSYESEIFADRQAFAQRLIKDARDAEDNPTQHYVILREAIKIASDNCDPVSAISALDKLNAEFKIDFWRLAKSSTEAILRKAKTKVQQTRVKRLLDQLTNQAVADERFVEARIFVGRAITLAKKLGIDADVESQKAFRKDILELEKMAKAGESAAIELAKSPDDPKTNLEYGNYLIFVKLEFVSGLEYWRKSDQPELRKLAEHESNPAATKDAKITVLGDLWFDYGNQTKGVKSRIAKVRSLHWYEKLVDQLVGESKAEIQLKIASLKMDVAPPTNTDLNEGLTVFDEKSRSAVDSALNWIIAHQLPDGGWSFDHRIGPGDHRTSSSPGSLKDARIGATSLAILALIKAGHTHKKGNYKRQVEAGVKFLLASATVKGNQVSFSETGGTMYSHGLATQALCELYRMTREKKIGNAAQYAVFYIITAQDPAKGGWRYRPGDAGDTSVTGWQLAALRSGKRARLNVPLSIELTNRFFDSVASPDRTSYGYTRAPTISERTPTARTAIALLGRLDIGWKKTNPAYVTAFANLQANGPKIGDSSDVYFNYHVTKLMYQHGGEAWDKWSGQIRAHLLQTQSENANETGSWWLSDRNALDRSGGRLYVTSLATLMLLEGSDQ